SHAFHSPLLEPMLGDLEAAAARMPLAAPGLALVSNVTGKLAGEELATPGYWRRHSRQPVRFADPVRSRHEQGCTIVLEIGPGATLVNLARRCLPDGAGVWLASLTPSGDDWRTLLESLAALYLRKVPVDWYGFDRGYLRRRLCLPTSPFERQRCWLETPA